MSDGYQSNSQAAVPPPSTPIINTEAIISIDTAKQNPLIGTTPNRNKLALINQNLLITKDFRMKPVNVPQVLNFTHVFNFPIPKSQPTSLQSGIIFSNLGQKFFYSVDDDGKVYLSGTFSGVNDELLFNITPYIVKVPLEYFPNQPS